MQAKIISIPVGSIGSTHRIHYEHGNSPFQFQQVQLEDRQHFHPYIFAPFQFQQVQLEAKTENRSLTTKLDFNSSRFNWKMPGNSSQHPNTAFQFQQVQLEEKNSMKMRGILSISIPVGSIGSGEFQPATKENVNFNSSRFNWKWRARCNITVPFVISIPVGSIGRINL